jgi:hypothetical protein
MTDDARQPSEEELRAAYEAEIKKIRVEQIVLENIVTLVNLGMRRTGLMPGTEDERDPAQVQVAIEGVRAQLPLIEQIAPDQAPPIQDAVSQLQMAFVQMSGAASGVSSPGAAPPSQPNPPSAATPSAPGQEVPADAPGPAQRSGRLWIPGQ